MSEFRKNPFTGEMTLYAANRKNRPYEFRHEIQTKPAHSQDCPFCGGQEAQTEKAVYQDDTDAAWQVRVFPNRYPAVSANASLQAESEAFYEKTAGIGQHEVLVDTRVHEQTIETFSVAHIARVLAVLQKRSRAIAENAAVAYVQIFKNCGAAAGMSMRHSHWQLMGIPILPERIQKMSEKMGADCLFCKMLAYEQTQKNRVTGETTHFVAVAPYASRFPYEIWLAPKRHQRSFVDLEAAERVELAAFLREILQKLVRLQEGIGYNICIMDAPKERDFHWHIEILPRIGGSAGFEYATDCVINSVLPEDAAAYYREKEKME